MIDIRIFRTRKEAEWAKNILAEGGVNATVSEDTFNSVPIQRYRVPARFRLKVADKDFIRAARFLAKKLRTQT